MMDKHDLLAMKYLTERLGEAKSELNVWREWALQGRYFYNPVTKKIEVEES